MGTDHSEALLTSSKKEKQRAERKNNKALTSAGQQAKFEQKQEQQATNGMKTMDALNIAKTKVQMRDARGDVIKRALGKDDGVLRELQRMSIMNPIEKLRKETKLEKSSTAQQAKNKEQQEAKLGNSKEAKLGKGSTTQQATGKGPQETVHDNEVHLGELNDPTKGPATWLMECDNGEEAHHVSPKPGWVKQNLGPTVVVAGTHRNLFAAVPSAN